MFKKVAVLMAALMTLSLLLSACGGNEFNYNGDMSKYVTLSDAALKASIDVGKQPVIDDEAVNAQIGLNLTTLWPYDSAIYEEVPTEEKKENATASDTETSTAQKTQERENYIKDEAIEKTDLTYIYYYGVTASDGKPFDGGSNMAEKKPTALLIGSGNFIEGFEDGLLGVKPSDTSISSDSKNTKIEKDSVVYLTVTTTYKKPAEKEGEKETTVTYSDYTFKNETRVDFASEDILAELFRDKAVENGVGKEFTVKDIEITVAGKDYMAEAKVKVTKVVKDVCVEVTFPEDYSETKLQGKDAKFYVVVDGFLPFEEVATVLGDDKTELKADKDKTLYETYFDKIEKELKEDYEKDIVNNRYNAIWDYLKATAKVEVPHSVFAQYREEAEENWRYTYENGSYYYYGISIPYKNMYDSFDKMMTAHYREIYGQSYNGKWADDLSKECETEIAERILLHYLADKLNVTVKDADVDAKWKELKEDLDAQGAEYKTSRYKEAVRESLLWDALMAKLDSADFVTVEEVETEAPTEKPTEAPTEGTTEEPSEEPSEELTEAPTAA